MSNLSLLQTVTKAGEEYWRKKTIEENLNRISRGSSETILKSRYKNPENGIFHLASELITETEYNLKEEYLTLYYFTNFSASVDCEIYKIPNPVFRFLNLVLKYSGRYWNNFVNRHYWIKGGVWNDEEGRWMVKSTLLSEEEIINKGNTIYKKLITGENILNNIYRYTSDNYKKNKEIDSIIAIYYAEEVLKMTSEQIGKIKEVGLRIFNLMQQQNDYKKYMVQLEGATKAFMLRSVLLNMIKKNYVSGNEKTLLGLDEWVNYLFPDGHYWSETRDLLLIFLYEKLHENRLKVEK
jgi:CRISPR-associated protein Cst1